MNKQTTKEVTKTETKEVSLMGIYLLYYITLFVLMPLAIDLILKPLGIVLPYGSRVSISVGVVILVNSLRALTRYTLEGRGI